MSTKIYIFVVPVTHWSWSQSSSKTFGTLCFRYDLDPYIVMSWSTMVSSHNGFNLAVLTYYRKLREIKFIQILITNPCFSLLISNNYPNICVCKSAPIETWRYFSLIYVRSEVKYLKANIYLWQRTLGIFSIKFYIILNFHIVKLF